MRSRIVAQKRSVFLHRRPAAGGVDDDRLDVGALEDVDHPPRQRERAFLLARVRQERAAAWLLRRRDDFIPLRREHSRHDVKVEMFHRPEKVRSGG